MQVHGILANDEERKKRVEELLERVSLGKEHFYRLSTRIFWRAKTANWYRKSISCKSKIHHL